MKNVRAKNGLLRKMKYQFQRVHVNYGGREKRSHWKRGFIFSPLDQIIHKLGVGRAFTRKELCRRHTLNVLRIELNFFKFFLLLKSLNKLVFSAGHSRTAHNIT